MTKLFLICLVSFLVGLTHTDQSTEPKLQIDIRTLRKLGDFKCLDSGNVYYITVTMKNISADTLKYWTMTCSRSDYFTTNKVGISFCREICRSNSPTIMELKPCQQDSFYLHISTKASIDSSFKIGFVYLTEDVPFDSWESRANLIKRKKLKNEVVWSSTLKP